MLIPSGKDIFLWLFISMADGEVPVLPVKAKSAERYFFDKRKAQ